MDDDKKRFQGRGKRPSPGSGPSDRPRPGSEKRPRDRSDATSSYRREDRAGGKPGNGPRDRQPANRSEAEPAVASDERIAKRLARAGISSRRDAEELVVAGRVRVNGTVLTSPAFNVGPQDKIEIDGTAIPDIERTRLFLFHKPAGVVTTNRDPQGRKTIFDVLPAGLPRLMTIGRLDITTEGLLLLTNDGGLARVLELPATGWLRRYRVRVHGKVEEAALAGLRDGIAVDGVFYGAVEAALDREQGSNAWLTIGLREGKNREVKKILGALGLEVTRLIRLSFGPFQLGELGEGEVLELKGRLLRDQLGERLIAESGANFEAPVAKEFSNRPVHARDDAARASPPRPTRAASPHVEEGGLVRNRKRDRERKREDALGRLQTARPAGFDKKRGKEERPYEPARSRKSNVWMAPGARPAGKKESAPSGNRSAADKPAVSRSEWKSRPGNDAGPSARESSRRFEGKAERSAPTFGKGREKSPADTRPPRPRDANRPSGPRKPPKGR